ncbi:MAG: GNAT family N-acetyltransferase [Fusobacteriaceae bacterium]
MEIEKAECFICIEADKLLGMCWYFFREESGEKICHISQMAVVKEHQGMGISTKFLSALEKICSEKGVKKIDLNVGAINKLGIDFYKKNNFLEERILMKKQLC